MLRSYLNAIHGIETEVHKQMMSKIDENVDQLYDEFYENERDSPTRLEYYQETSDSPNTRFMLYERKGWDLMASYPLFDSLVSEQGEM